jgi:uncharacterized surface protein with fasciclin (FAS1) repeats
MLGINNPEFRMREQVDRALSHKVTTKQEEKLMKTKIIVLALLLVLAPLGGVMAQQPMTIYDTLKAAGNFTTLVTLIDKARDAKSTLQMPGPFTVFAANDAAFAKLPQDVMNKIMTNDALMNNVVYLSIIPGKYQVENLPELKECKTLCPAANAQPLRFTKMGPGKFLVNDANIVKPDMLCTNGVVQEIDTVLMPSMAPPHQP